MTFEDPAFLQNLGRVTISFALLDGTLTAVTDFLVGAPALEQIAAMEFKRKVECFTGTAASEFERLSTATQFDRPFFQQLRADLNSLADERNTLMHDFWTVEVETQQMVLKGLKRKNRGQKSYPTAESLKTLSDRIYHVRSRLAPVMNEYQLLRRKHAEAEQSRSGD